MPHMAFAGILAAGVKPTHRKNPVILRLLTIYQTKGIAVRRSSCKTALRNWLTKIIGLLPL